MSNRCKFNCKEKVVTSHRFALKATTPPSGLDDAIFKWRLYKKGIESNESTTVWYSIETLHYLIATKTRSKNIVFNEEELQKKSSYWLTLDVKLANGTRGWAAYHFNTAATPSAGTCTGKQLDRERLGISLNISCTGWKDEHKPLIFEFYQVHKLEDLTPPHLLSHSVLPYSEVQLPEFTSGKVEVKTVVINSLGARTESFITIDVSRKLNS